MPSLKVTKKHQDTRLDLFLTEMLKISRKKAKQQIDKGQVFIGNRKIIIASWKLQEGDLVEIADSKKTGLPRRRRYLRVYFEDRDILVVEKPPGVACERTPQTLTSTLVDDINDYLQRAHPDKPFPYVGLMHRLDRETSGLMIFTLSKRANKLAGDFRSHKIGRRYLALVEGKIQKGEGRINRPIRKDPKAQGKKMMTFQSKGAVKQGRALTDYFVKERYPDATLVEVHLLTGRTHQVRVHFSSLGHPVVGDMLYGSKRKAPRQMLHASFLEFRHPVTGKKLKFKSPPPNDFQKLLEKFRSRTS